MLGLAWATLGPHLALLEGWGVQVHRHSPSIFLRVADLVQANIVVDKSHCAGAEEAGRGEWRGVVSE